MWAAFGACATGWFRGDGARSRASVRQPSACCSASILIARDRARRLQADFIDLSIYWRAMLSVSLRRCRSRFVVQDLALSTFACHCKFWCSLEQLAAFVLPSRSMAARGSALLAAAGRRRRLCAGAGRQSQALRQKTARGASHITRNSHHYT